MHDRCRLSKNQLTSNEKKLLERMNPVVGTAEINVKKKACRKTEVLQQARFLC